MRSTYFNSLSAFAIACVAVLAMANISFAAPGEGQCAKAVFSPPAAGGPAAGTISASSTGSDQVVSLARWSFNGHGCGKGCNNSCSSGCNSSGAAKCGGNCGSRCDKGCGNSCSSGCGNRCGSSVAGACHRSGSCSGRGSGYYERGDRYWYGGYEHMGDNDKNSVEMG